MWNSKIIFAPDRPESRFNSESPKPALNVNSSCATSSPAGPAWLEPCRHLSTKPRRRHHRQPRHRAAGERRAPRQPLLCDLHRGERHRPRPPDGDLPRRWGPSPARTASSTRRPSRPCPGRPGVPLHSRDQRFHAARILHLTGRCPSTTPGWTPRRRRMRCPGSRGTLKGCLPAWMRWGVDGRMVVFSVPGAGALEEEGEFLASRWWRWSGM